MCDKRSGCKSFFFALLLISGLLNTNAWGRTAPVLGSAWENAAAGISLRPPADSKTIRRAVSGDEIVEFINDSKNWLLKVSRMTLREPLGLTASAGDNSRPGLLELTAEQFAKANPGAKILRKDVINTGSNNVAMLAMRYTQNAQHRLTQQALVQSSEQVYYVLTFTSPAGELNSPEASADPREKEAVEVFRAVLDTVKLLDRGPIREDQEQRLIRTRAWLVNLSEKKLRGALIPEQWLRLIREGKDIGYTYIVEEADEKGPGGAGIKIGIRSRTVPDKGMQVDAESWLMCTFDRKHEDWSNIAVVDDGSGKKNYVSEFGTTQKQRVRVLDQTLAPDRKDPGQPPVRPEETYTLEVTTVAKSATAQPLKRPLPPWYLPQALGHLLPRLLPLAEPKTYMFAGYISDQREVVARYLDVGREQNVNLGGQSVRAIAIKDRVGLEGSSTTHYLSPEGKYLGSVNEDSKIVILPTDAAKLRKLWLNPTLTRPQPAQKPAAVTGSN